MCMLMGASNISNSVLAKPNKAISPPTLLAPEASASIQEAESKSLQTSDLDSVLVGLMVNSTSTVSYQGTSKKKYLWLIKKYKNAVNIIFHK